MIVLQMLGAVAAIAAGPVMTIAAVALHTTREHTKRPVSYDYVPGAATT